MNLTIIVHGKDYYKRIFILLISKIINIKFRVGTCVGKRNYRFFFLFLTSALLLCLYSFGFSIAHVVIESTKKDDEGKSAGFVEGIKKAPASCFIVLYSIMTVLAVIGLWGYHCTLVIKGVTTSEDVCILLFFIIII